MLEVAAGRLRGGLVRGFFAFGGAVDMVGVGGDVNVFPSYRTGKEVRPSSCLPGLSVE